MSGGSGGGGSNISPKSNNKFDLNIMAKQMPKTLSPSIMLPTMPPAGYSFSDRQSSKNSKSGKMKELDKIKIKTNNYMANEKATTVPVTGNKKSIYQPIRDAAALLKP